MLIEITKITTLILSLMYLAQIVLQFKEETVSTNPNILALVWAVFTGVFIYLTFL